MNRDDIIRMAREVGIVFANHTAVGSEENLLQNFAALVAAAERNRLWTQAHWTEYERSIVAAEREACARLCDEVGGRDSDTHAWDAAVAIRARGRND